MSARSRRIAAIGAAMAAGVLLVGCSSPDSGVITEPSASTTGTTRPGPTTSTPSSSGTFEAPSSSLETTASVASVSPSSNSAAPWPADFTQAQQDAATAALETVNGYTSLLSVANADPAGRDWSVEFRRYAVQAVADSSAATVRSLQDAGVRISVPVKYEDATVTAADEHRVSVQVCVDSSRAQLVDGQDNPVKLDAAVPRALSFYTLALFAPADGGWLILDRPAPSAAQPC